MQINISWPLAGQKGLGMVHYLFQSALEATAELAETVAEEAAPVVTAANENLIGQALRITLVGMGILFVSLLILWGVMELLVRLVKDGPKEEEEEEVNASPVMEAADAGDEMKLKAAAAAAAYVIAKK